MAKDDARRVKCKTCGHSFPENKGRCPSCKAWVTEAKVEGYGSVLLEDIKNADVDRIQTGPWDICFGQNDSGQCGVVRGSSNLIAGAPGGGKSTMFLQASANVIETYPDLDVLYLSAEEQLPQIKARAERLNINGKRRLRFIDLRKGDADLLAVLKAFKFGLLIIDSLKAIAPDDAERIEVCKIAKNFGVDTNAPVIISHHINKEEDAAGLMAIQHEVDATLLVVKDRSRRTRTDAGLEPVRIIETTKNRNGQVTEAEFAMTSRGLVPLKEFAPEQVEGADPDEEEEEDDDE